MPTPCCAPPPLKRNEWIVRYNKVKYNRFTVSQYDIFKEKQNKAKQRNGTLHMPCPFNSQDYEQTP